MTASDEYIPDVSELQALLAVAAAPEIVRASEDLGVDSSYSAHAFAHGKESLLFGISTAPWAVRVIFRAAHAPNRVLVQVQARLRITDPSGYSGFLLKGSYDRSSPSTFLARSKTNEYNTVNFRAWA